MEIKREELARLAYLNSKRCPEVINDGGVRKRWTGIGWVSEGALKGDEVLGVDEPKKGGRKRGSQAT
jgi:hypothetical protein